MASRWGKWRECKISFSWTLKSMWMVAAATQLKDAYSLEGQLWQTERIEKQKHDFANKGLSSQSYGIFNNHVWMWELGHKEGWAPNWCFPTAVYGVTQSRTRLKRLSSSSSKCGAGEDPWESLGQRGDPTSQSWRKWTLNIHLKDWCWSFSILATWCEEPTHW